MSLLKAWQGVARQIGVANAGLSRMARRIGDATEEAENLGEAIPSAPLILGPDGKPAGGGGGGTRPQFAASQTAPRYPDGSGGGGPLMPGGGGGRRRAPTSPGGDMVNPNINSTPVHPFFSGGAPGVSDAEIEAAIAIVIGLGIEAPSNWDPKGYKTMVTAQGISMMSYIPPSVIIKNVVMFKDKAGEADLRWVAGLAAHRKDVQSGGSAGAMKGAAGFSKMASSRSSGGGGGVGGGDGKSDFRRYVIEGGQVSGIFNVDARRPLERKDQGGGHLGGGGGGGNTGNRVSYGGTNGGQGSKLGGGSASSADCPVQKIATKLGGIADTVAQAINRTAESAGQTISMGGKQAADDFAEKAKSACGGQMAKMSSRSTPGGGHKTQRRPRAWERPSWPQYNFIGGSAPGFTTSGDNPDRGGYQGWTGGGSDNSGGSWTGDSAFNTLVGSTGKSVVEGVEQANKPVVEGINKMVDQMTKLNASLQSDGGLRYRTGGLS